MFISYFDHLHRDDEIKQITADHEKLMIDKEALERAYKASLDEREKLTNQRVRKF